MATQSESSVGSAEVRPLKRRWDPMPMIKTLSQSFEVLPMNAERPGQRMRQGMNEEEKRAIETLQKIVLSQQQALMQQAQVQQMQLFSNQIPVAQPTVSRMWASNIDPSMTEADIIKIFSVYGSVVSIQMQKELDPKAGRTVFVDYSLSAQADIAISSMNNQTLGGRVIKTGRPLQSTTPMPAPPLIPTGPTPFLQSLVSSAINPVQPMLAAATGIPSVGMGGVMPAFASAAVVAAAVAAKAAATAASKNRIYVGSIHWDITEEAISKLFANFGQIRSCHLLPNLETGKHKGYGFVEFEDVSAAEQAVSQMNGTILGGRQIKVSWAAAGAGANQPLPGVSIGVPAVVAGVNSGIAPNVVLPAGVESVKRKGEESLSHEENMTISGDQRYLIMQKLFRSDGLSVSRCIVMRNMVGPEEVDDFLEDEVESECKKYGAVEKVVIFKSDIVKIFVMFQNPNGASAARDKINGRFFGGRVVKVDFYDEARFRSRDFSG